MKTRLPIAVGMLAALLLGVGFARTTTGSGRDDAPPQLLMTSTFGTTSAVLFVLEPQGRYLAAYEAVPGEAGGLRLLGARKIEHDLELTEYRDRSEWSWEKLHEKKQNLGPAAADKDSGNGN